MKALGLGALLRLATTVLAGVGTALPASGVEPARIHYFEGEPRYELKFVRGALQSVDDLRLVVLMRTAEERFSRFDVDSPDELADGFPRTLAELERYDALVLGSVELGSFTQQQLRAIRDYVYGGRRLLLLGGRLALAGGDWRDSAVDEMVPIDLDPPPVDEHMEIRVRPTAAAKDHPALNFAEGVEAFFADLPPLSMSPPGALRWEARELLEGHYDGGTVVVFAERSFGKGICAVLTPWDTWKWQMSAEVPPESDHHERFWIGLLRWLAQRD